MGTLGIEVLEEYLESVSTKVKLTNGQEWLLREGQAIFVCYLFIDGEQVSYEVNRKSLAEIYSHIRFLYDKDGTVIAQRWGIWNIETKMHGRKANECSIFLQIIRFLYFINSWSRDPIFFCDLCNWNSPI